MQQEMIAEIKKNDPEYIVYSMINTSWLRQEGSPSLIFDWFNEYAKEHYDLTGVVDILNDHTVYKWDNEAKYYKPEGINLRIYKKVK